MYQKGDRVTLKYIRIGQKQPTIEPGTVAFAGKSGDLTIQLDIGEIARRRQHDPDLRRSKVEEPPRTHQPDEEFK